MEDREAELDAYEDVMLAGAHGAVFGGGGRLGAELLRRKNSSELDLDLDLSPDEVALRARELLSSPLGLPEPPDLGDGTVRVVGIVGAGVLDMNPTLVIVTITGVASDASGHSHVAIRAVAKEGLIKQRAGEKAARRIAAEMASWRHAGG
jgi:hypothetical protein